MSMNCAIWRLWAESKCSDANLQYAGARRKKPVAAVRKMMKNATLVRVEQIVNSAFSTPIMTMKNAASISISKRLETLSQKHTDTRLKTWRLHSLQCIWTSGWKYPGCIIKRLCRSCKSKSKPAYNDFYQRAACGWYHSSVNLPYDIKTTHEKVFPSKNSKTPLMISIGPVTGMETALIHYKKSAFCDGPEKKVLRECLRFSTWARPSHQNVGKGRYTHHKAK